MAGEVEVIAKIIPKNAAFRGVVDADQVAGQYASFGVNMGSGTGHKGYRHIPYAITIVGWTLLGNAVGDLVVDLRTCLLGDMPDTYSICADAKPTLSAARYNSDTALTGWTTSVAAGTVVEFYVESNSGIGRATLDVQYERA